MDKENRQVKNFYRDKLVDGAIKVDEVLAKAMPLVPVIGLVLGVSLPWVFIQLRPHITWLFAAMTLSGALRLKARDLGRAALSPKPLIFYFFTSRILMPLIVYVLSRLAFQNDIDMAWGFVLLFAVPTAVTSFVWTTIFKGDLALVLTIIFLDTIMAPLVGPWTVRILLGATINLDTIGMALSLTYMIVIPTIAGVVLNESSKGKIPIIISPWIAPISKLAMIPIIAANASVVADQIRLDNPRVWIIIISCIFFNVLGFFIGKLMGSLGKLDREKQITLFLTTGLKNNSAAMILGIQFFPANAALPAVLGIMTQHIVAGIIGRFFTRNRTVLK